MPVKTIFNSMADIEVEFRGLRKTVLDEIDRLIDWQRIEKIIKKRYKKNANAAGNASYPAIAMFKVLLLQKLYNLSDPETEEALYDRISFTRFAGFSLASSLPDHSTICRFRNELMELKLYEKLFLEMNYQFEAKGILIKQGAIVDATVIQSSRRPKKTIETAVEDRKEAENPTQTEVRYSDDNGASWIKKGRTTVYGYKAHVGVDKERGFITGGHMSGANVSDMNQLEGVVDESILKTRTEIYCDKGYASKENREILKIKGMKERIMKKAARGKPLTKWEKRWNYLISKVRYKVEQAFGTLKRGFGFVRMRYLGLCKAQMEFFLYACVFNLKKAARMVA